MKPKPLNKTLPEAHRSSLIKDNALNEDICGLCLNKGFKGSPIIIDNLGNKAIFGLYVTYNNGLQYKLIPYLVKKTFDKCFKLNLDGCKSKGKFIGLRKCSDCGISIKVFKEMIGDKGIKQLVSPEGVLYYRSWFCNKCSNFIMSNNKMVGGLE